MWLRTQETSPEDRIGAGRPWKTVILFTKRREIWKKAWFEARGVWGA